MKDVFRSGDSSKKFKIAEGQWYRYAPSYVSPAYHLLEGFPFIQEPPSGDRSEERRVGKECRSRWSAYDKKKNDNNITRIRAARDAAETAQHDLDGAEDSEYRTI